ncbi:MAG: hypothetical protein ACOX3X_08470 [Eubacteriales bacterium]|jgi:hypothetical protein
MNTKISIENIYNTIASENGVSPDEVKNEIRDALYAGCQSDDPDAREFWSRLAMENECPTIDDIILHIITTLASDA